MQDWTMADRAMTDGYGQLIVNQLKITIERFYQLTGTYIITVLKASYVLRHMKFTLISKNYEHVIGVT